MSLSTHASSSDETDGSRVAGEWNASEGINDEHW